MQVDKFEEIEPLYREQAEVLAPHVDLLLCETMSSVDEGRAAAAAATRTGKPVWVCWTLHEDRSGRLRSVRYQERWQIVVHRKALPMRCRNWRKPA